MEVSLATEFSRYIMVQNILTNIAEFFPKTVSTLSRMDILESSFINYINDQAPNEDPIFSLRKTDIEYGYNRDTLNWFINKVGTKNGKKIYDVMIETIVGWLTRDKKNDETPQFKIVYNLIRVYTSKNSAIFIVPHGFLEFCRRKISDEDIVSIILRYSCTMDSIRQASICPDIYSIIINVYGVTIEGFSSPHSFQIRKFNDVGEFCSPFLDTDKVLGGLGSFFDQDFVGKNVSVFSPYSLSFDNKLYDHINETLIRAESLKKPTRFFIMLPSYLQSWILQFSSCKYTRKQILFPKYELYSIDSKSDLYLPSVIDSYFFILDYGYEHHKYNTFNNILDKIKTNCDILKKIDETIEIYEVKQELDFSTYLSKFNYRFVKQFINRIMYRGKIPQDIKDMLAGLGSGQMYFRQEIILQSIVNLNNGKSLRFSWEDIKKEMQVIIFDLMRE